MSKARDEAEWLAAQEPHVLLQSVTGRGRSRRHRLCAVACCRQVVHLLSDERCRRSLDVAEAYADRRATSDQLTRVWEETAEVLGAFGDYSTFGRAARLNAIGAVLSTTQTRPPGFAFPAVSQVAAALGCEQFPPEALFPADVGGASGFIQAMREAWQAQQVLLRDLLPNPFRPKTLGLPSLPPSILSMAHAAYDERLASFDLDPLRLSVLADALEDAGCTKEAILSHLRSPGPHYRGCWAVDLILGR